MRSVSREAMKYADSINAFCASCIVPLLPFAFCLYFSSYNRSLYHKAEVLLYEADGTRRTIALVSCSFLLAAPILSP